MAYIPKNAEWYIATLIQEITVQGHARNVVHKNLVLVRADSPDEAFEKAQVLGMQAEVSYDNPEGKLVQITFRGLGQLSVVHDGLIHGAELEYEELIGVSAEALCRLVRSKQDLSVFRPTSPTAGPDYSSKDILDEAGKVVDNPTIRIKMI